MDRGTTNSAAAVVDADGALAVPAANLGRLFYRRRWTTRSSSAGARRSPPADEARVAVVGKEAEQMRDGVRARPVQHRAKRRKPGRLPREMQRDVSAGESREADTHHYVARGLPAQRPGRGLDGLGRVVRKLRDDALAFLDGLRRRGDGALRGSRRLTKTAIERRDRVFARQFESRRDHPGAPRRPAAYSATKQVGKETVWSSTSKAAALLIANRAGSWMGTRA